MTTERHWEAFEEADHGNAQQMRDVAHRALQELSFRDESKMRLSPFLFNKLILDLYTASRQYGATQQFRAHLVNAVSQFIEPDHPHTRR